MAIQANRHQTVNREHSWVRPVSTVRRRAKHSIWPEVVSWAKHALFMGAIVLIFGGPSIVRSYGIGALHQVNRERKQLLHRIGEMQVRRSQLHQQLEQLRRERVMERLDKEAGVEKVEEVMVLGTPGGRVP